MAVLAAAIVLAGCTTSYWGRPGGTLPVLAEESEACYHAALAGEAPSALPGTGPTTRLLPRSEPPPKLWERAPRQAGFERVDQQLRYQRCMTAKGWEARRSATSPR